MSSLDEVPIPADITATEVSHVYHAALAVLCGDGESKHSGAWVERPDPVDLDAITRHIDAGLDQIDADSGMLHAHHIVARALLVAIRASRRAGELGDGE